jgi:hypothetical protein
MITASRILGDEVGSTAPVFLAILAVHVIAGLAAVITGATAALTRKGSPHHIRAGRWYYRAISTVFATAAGLAIIRWAQDHYLFIIGAVAFAAATIGYLHRRLHRPGDTGHIAGMGISYTAMLTAFYVDNGPHLPLWDRLPALVFWFLPSAIGTPIIARAMIRARKTGPQLSCNRGVSELAGGAGHVRSRASGRRDWRRSASGGRDPTPARCPPGSRRSGRSWPRGWGRPYAARRPRSRT